MMDLSDKDKALALWDEMARTFHSFPKGVVPVPEPIRGTAFFPGGLGLLLDESRDPQPEGRKVMVVGQDFNSVATYRKAQEEGSEVGTSQTWRNLARVFAELGIELGQCFFTNFYMGLRESAPETGRFPGARDEAFVQSCARFFARQMEVVRPPVIVCLGLAPLQALGKEVFGLQVPNTLSECVDVYDGLSTPFGSPGPHGRVALVALIHPSLYFANVRRRRFQGYCGREAERAMIQQVMTGKS
jgi:uracil-DNA glycosylase